MISSDQLIAATPLTRYPDGYSVSYMPRTGGVGHAAGFGGKPGGPTPRLGIDFDYRGYRERMAAQPLLVQGGVRPHGSPYSNIDAYFGPEVLEPSVPWWHVLWDLIFRASLDSWKLRVVEIGQTRRRWWGDWAGLDPQVTGYGVKLYWLALALPKLRVLHRLAAKSAVTGGLPLTDLEEFASCGKTIAQFCDLIGEYFSADFFMLRLQGKMDADEAGEKTAAVKAVAEELKDLEDEARRMAMDDASDVRPGVYSGR